MNFFPRTLLAALFALALAACARPAPGPPPVAALPTAAVFHQGGVGQVSLHGLPADRVEDARSAPAAPLPTAIVLSRAAASAATEPRPSTDESVVSAGGQPAPPVTAVVQQEPTAAPEPAPPTPEPAPPAPEFAPPIVAPIAEAAAAPVAELSWQLTRSTPARIIIDSIGLDRELVAVGLDSANAPVVPDHDVAWYERSASPGAGENVVIWGHALRFRATAHIPAPLERVREARVGDRVTIVTADGVTHSYVISEQIWATPDQVRYILPAGDERLTIVNCIGDYVVDATGEVVSMTHRLITLAEPIR